MAVLEAQYSATAPAQRARLTIRGMVQGVGFRPYVYRLATSLGLHGCVQNAPHGVLVEVEGRPAVVAEFLRRLPIEAPRPARPERIETVFVTPTRDRGFKIIESRTSGHRTALVMPDLAVCDECLLEVFDKSNRRFRYPFTNCIQCGPRFSIIDAIPYDRQNTSMREFHMCRDCQAEYDDPSNRRFHAQPNACPRCGPHLEYWSESGATLATHDDALMAAADSIRAGRIVAVKGIGGFHLMVDARNEEAVRRLRLRKSREEKPLALMMPGLASTTRACEVSAAESNLLLSPAAPIVLLCRRENALGNAVAPNVAPGNPHLGTMLPYAPLHHLLMRELGFPIIATSGNRSDEPICIDEREALVRLSGIADFFLVHNRPIVRPVDDSVARVALGGDLLIRRSRGYAPLPVDIDSECEPILAVGAHLKNTIALATGPSVFVSQHIGDLESPQSLSAFEQTADALQRLYDVRPRVIACDMHPDYLSTQHAHRIVGEIIPVQHHHAHVAACMAEHGLQGTVLGVCWDGTGYGPDGTIWGGEFLRATRDTFSRIAHLRTFPLPGGARAVREPRCSAFGLLYEAFGLSAIDMEELAPMRAFAREERRVMARMIERNINAPRTSSMGRLFDAVASLLDLRQTGGFEGQAAMELEFAAADVTSADPYPLTHGIGASTSEVDWIPMLGAIIADLKHGMPREQIAARFHQTLIAMILKIAKSNPELPVVLSGGCFQNMKLLEGVVHQLRSVGRAVYWPQHVPTNDGGISLGQVVVAAARLRGREPSPCA